MEDATLTTTAVTMIDVVATETTDDVTTATTATTTAVAHLRWMIDDATIRPEVDTMTTVDTKRLRACPFVGLLPFPVGPGGPPPAR